MPWLISLAVECGAVLSLAISADQTTIAGGHANGTIFTWEATGAAKPFLHLPPLTAEEIQVRKVDGHIADVGVLHLGFLGTRRTALVSADGRGMAFSHLASRGLGPLRRTVKTTRILGRYPDDSASDGRPRKPSSVLAFSALPLGNVEHTTDNMGLVAMLTPYMLVIVSTTPIAQTQHKAGKPKEIEAQSALSGCLAWFPSVKLKADGRSTMESVSKAKLVYCWSDVLTVLDVSEVEPSDITNEERPNLSFRARSRWRAGEPIVAVQWLGRSVLAVLTITQQLLILEDNVLTVTDAFDLINRQIAHHDFFSKYLELPNHPSEEIMRGVIADSFFMSFRVYKGRIFLLGVNEISVGTLSNWAQRLMFSVEDGHFVEAIRLAISYFDGEVDRLTLGLPDEESARHRMVQEKLLEIISASLKHTFGESGDASGERASTSELQQLSGAYIAACAKVDAFDFLFEDVYDVFEQNSSHGIFLETMEPYILTGQITSAPPSVIKSLVDHYTRRKSETLLEEMICRMDTATMDIDQITSLCKQYNLYDALIYVWNQALQDYVSPLVELLAFLVQLSRSTLHFDDAVSVEPLIVNVYKLFPYLSYTLTGRIYPTGADRAEDESLKSKAELYWFVFSGKTVNWPKAGGKPVLTRLEEGPEPSFPYLRLILKHDAASFLGALNEAFEDPFLNGTPDNPTDDVRASDAPNEQLTRYKIDRQYLVSILLDVMASDEFTSEQTIYLDMFLARNLPKFPQFILLSGTSLHRVLVGLCKYPSEDVAEDCQLSVEYLLSMYHPADLDTLIPLFERAHFYRVLKLVHKAERQYGKLLQVYFDDANDQEEVFACIGDLLRPNGLVKDRQLQEVREVIRNHAGSLLSISTTRTAEIIDRYAADLHERFLESLDGHPHGQFVYLRAILDSPSKGLPEAGKDQKEPHQAVIELYVRLMCKYDPTHVVDYINFLQSGDLRLEQVLPAMESEGVVDAAVVLMARKGQVRSALTRLLGQMDTLEASLLGLLSSSGGGDSSMAEKDLAVEEVMSGFEKYVAVGMWLCQQQGMATQGSDSSRKPATQRLSSSDKSPLSFEELLWVDLIDSLVRSVKNATNALRSSAATVSLTPGSTSRPPSFLDDSKVINTLRGFVQQVFTVLLTSTSSTKSPTTQAPPGSHMNSTPTGSTLLLQSSSRSSVSFLRILRAFLTRATLNSPSLSELRAVLSSIFSAYAYEESLLSLSLKLLEKDLFVHVADVTERRSRGWRPRSQLCEGCGRRVWGPGTGTAIWDAWRVREAQRRLVQKRPVSSFPSSSTTSATDPARTAEEEASRKRKGKGVADARFRVRLKDDVDYPPQSHRPPIASHDPSSVVGVDQQQQQQPADPIGPLIIFACQHVFHRACLDKLCGSSSSPSTTELDDGGQLLRRRPGGAEASLDETTNVALGGGEGKDVRCVICR